MQASILTYCFDMWLQIAHVLEDLAFAIVDTLLAVEAMLEDFALGVQLVNDWVGVASLVVCENGHLSELGHLKEEFSQVRSLVDIDATRSVLFILWLVIDRKKINM